MTLLEVRILKSLGVNIIVPAGFKIRAKNQVSGCFAGIRVLKTKPRKQRLSRLQEITDLPGSNIA